MTPLQPKLHHQERASYGQLPQKAPCCSHNPDRRRNDNVGKCGGKRKQELSRFCEIFPQFPPLHWGNI